MNFKTFLNGIVLFIGLGLAAYSQFNKNTQPPSSYESPKLPPKQEQKFEIWQLKSIHDGDTLRVFKGSEELKIRLCGIDSPEIKQSLGIEARDHLRSLVDIGNGELLLVPVEKDRYERTVAEVYAQNSNDTAIALNLQMVRDGYAWHYEKYSGNCPSKNEYAIAQELAQKESLGIWKGNPQPPWEWRKANK